jgi:hypothetical protein
MTALNDGYNVEKQIAEMFKGTSHQSDAVDFQTDDKLVEVKACRIVIRTTNKKDDELIEGSQYGRFWIKECNHRNLKELGEKESKSAVYVFAVYFNNQFIWVEKSWEEVDKLLTGKKDSNFHIALKDVFPCHL